MTPLETAIIGIILVALAPYVLQGIKMLRTPRPAPRGSTRKQAAPDPNAGLDLVSPRPVAATGPLERAS